MPCLISTVACPESSPRFRRARSASLAPASVFQGPQAEASSPSSEIRNRFMIVNGHAWIPQRRNPSDCGSGFQGSGTCRRHPAANCNASRQFGDGSTPSGVRTAAESMLREPTHPLTTDSSVRDRPPEDDRPSSRASTGRGGVADFAAAARSGLRAVRKSRRRQSC